ncbi:MAG: glycosyltransferase family 2 protein [Polyangiaceae bacterium]
MTALALAVLCLLSIVLYTYAGYPLGVALLARLFPRRSRCEPGYEPSVSVLLSVANGGEYLTKKLESLLDLDYPAERLEILVYSDGSTDETATILEDMARRHPRIEAHVCHERAGKPTAQNRLAARARNEVLVLTDVRQPLSRDAIRELVAPLSDPTVGCVSGNLVLEGDTGAGAYWRYERFIRTSEGRLGRLVGVSGALYAVRRSDFPELPAEVILDDMYVPLEIALSGKRVVFADGARAFDRALEDEREFPRKVRTLAGNYQLLRLLPRLLSPSNRSFFTLVSHKLLRLFCPWALASVFVASAVLALAPEAELGSGARLAWRGFFFAQLAFYVLALIGPRAGRGGALARTFVVLNAAAVVGLARYLKGGQAVTW